EPGHRLLLVARRCRDINQLLAQRRYSGDPLSPLCRRRAALTGPGQRVTVTAVAVARCADRTRSATTAIVRACSSAVPNGEAINALTPRSASRRISRRTESS